MIDLHSHVLPGVDDGARTLEQSLDIANAAYRDGIRMLAATPHVRSDYPTEPETMERLVAELRAALAERDISLDLRPGGEIALDQLPALAPEDLRRFGLGGSRGYLLLEMPYAGWPHGLRERVFELQLQGLTPVLAHPERNADVQASPARLEELVAAGALVQVTAASVDGRLGRSARASALDLIKRGLAHLLASDAHAPDLRSIGLSAAREAVGDKALGRWLTEDVPAAIVEDAPAPERPARAGRLWWARR